MGTLGFLKSGIDGYGKIQPKKGEDWNSRFDIDEMGFKIEGDTVHCYGYLSNSDAYMLKDDNGNKPELPGLFYWSFDGSNSSCEKALKGYFSELDASKRYAGFIYVNAQMVVTDGLEAALKPTLFALTEVPQDKVKDDAVKQTPQGKGSKYKTPAERLAETLDAAKSALQGEQVDEVLLMIESKLEAPMTNEQRLDTICRILF